MSHFESIKQGLIEAIEHAAGQESEAVVHPPRTPDVKAIRQNGELQDCIDTPNKQRRL